MSSLKMGRWCSIAVVFWLLMSTNGKGASGLPPGSEAVEIGWTASTDPTVVGYYVYYFASNNVYTNKLDVGTNTTSIIAGMVPGQTYHFFVTSYNASRTESVPTPEIDYLALGILTASVANNTLSVRFPVAPGGNFELQASTDMKTWSDIWDLSNPASNAWVGYSEPLSNIVAAKFFRVLNH